MRARALAAGLWLLAACHNRAAPPVAPRPAAPAPATALPTTDGAIALGNLESQLAASRRAVARFHRPEDLAALVAQLGQHGQFAGRIDEREEAARLADELVARAPSAASYALRAAARSALHRFADAAADLDAAALRGAPAAALDGARAAIWQATGREDDALALRHRLAERAPDLTTLGQEAALLGELGRADEAERLFARAPERFADVSPFPVAWLLFQQGLMEERTGRLARARELFQAARDRLPGYAAAAGHLAAVEAATGSRARAIALLEPLVARSDDPEYWAQLGALAASPSLVERARARYDELVARQPAAFADHAARFWLGAGGDARKALALAQQNLAARPTRDAHQLVIEAALATGDFALACRVAAAASSLPHAGPPLRVACARAFTACGDPARAARELAASR